MTLFLLCFLLSPDSKHNYLEHFESKNFFMSEIFILFFSVEKKSVFRKSKRVFDFFEKVKVTNLQKITLKLLLDFVVLSIE